MKHSIMKALAILVVFITTAIPLSAAEVVTYYHNDHLGSPIAATDSTGAVIWQQAYDPWGLKLTTNTDERGYTGNWFDEETGLADHKARWYTSSIGRFTAIDPVKWQESSIHSFNRYAYSNNNPYSFTDRDGRFALPVIPILTVLALEATGVYIEGITMEPTEDAIYRSGAGTFGLGAIKAGQAAKNMALSFRGLRIAGLSKGQLNTAIQSAQTAKKGSTVMGHSLSKHANRHPEIWGKLSGSMNTWNETAMKHFEEIIGGPGKFKKEVSNGIEFIEKRLSDRRGIRLNKDYTFKGFID